MLRIRIHRPPSGLIQTNDPACIPEVLADPLSVLWVDLEAPSAGEIRILSEVFRFHALTIEDCVEPRHHPKIDDFGQYLFIIMHAVKLADGGSSDGFESAEVNFYLGPNYLVTHHEEPLPSIEHGFESIEHNPQHLARGAPVVLHEILDAMVDRYLPVMDEMDEEIEALEDAVVASPTRKALNRILTLKRSIQRIRRITSHQKEILYRLSRGEFELIPPNHLMFYRDVHDHLVRVADLAESYRDLLSGTLEAYLSTTSNKLSEVMKALTLITTILLPMTVVAGIYGMNFDPAASPFNMPELHWKYGYFFSLASMAAVGGSMFAYFRLKKWI